MNYTPEPTYHFNELTEAEQERLAILIEECSEVIQIGCKILRHGYESFNPTIPQSETNRAALERELGDLFHAYHRMVRVLDVNMNVVDQRSQSKPQRIEKYLHHQPNAADQTETPTQEN